MANPREEVIVLDNEFDNVFSISRENLLKTYFDEQSDLKDKESLVTVYEKSDAIKDESKIDKKDRRETSNYLYLWHLEEPLLFYYDDGKLLKEWVTSQ